MVGTGGVMPRSAEALDAMDEEVQGSIEIALVCGGGTATPIDSFCDLLSVLTPAEPQLAPPTAADFPSAAPPSLRPVWEEACAKLSAQVIPPIGAEGLNRRPPAGPCRLFLGPGFRLGAR